jgi:hypothetical protein
MFLNREGERASAAAEPTSNEKSMLAEYLQVLMTKRTTEESFFCMVAKQGM